MKTSHLKHDTYKSNLQIAEWMNEISIAGETYSEIVRQKFTLYSTSSCQLFKDYVETRRSDWEEDNNFTAVKVRYTDLNKYNNPLTSGRWYTKYTKDYNILSLVGATQKLADDSNKSSDKSNTSNRETTNGELFYINDRPPWMLEDPECRV